MAIHCFTSVTANYVAKAWVLADSVRKHHPDWQFHVVMCEPADVLTGEEPFDHVWQLEDLGIRGLPGWVFSHSLVELCTAVKGAALHAILSRPDADAVIYLDPDTVVFSPLSAVTAALPSTSVVLTPHLLEPDDELSAISDNEINSALLHGVYNLGFIAVAADDEGFRFARWWRDRLLEFCYDDKPRGLFTDQRWVDLVPAFFARHKILRDPGYNVATWNLSRRDVAMSPEGEITVNGRPLAFYHFTGYDSGAGRIMVNRYGRPSSPVFDLWDWYDAAIAERGQAVVGELEWAYSSFDDGTPIEPSMRLMYRNRPDLQAAFADPFNVDDHPTFQGWWKSNSALES